MLSCIDYISITTQFLKSILDGYIFIIYKTVIKGKHDRVSHLTGFAYSTGAFTSQLKKIRMAYCNEKANWDP